MLIHAVTLYKTPLDPDYTNVFDDVTDANYKSFLDLNYSKTEPLPEIADMVRSLRSSGNTVDIIVIGEKEYLRDYNYCCLQISEALDTPKKYVYYFIMSMDSTSNVNPSTTRITLKYDAFSNNRMLLADGIYNDENMVEQRHFEECKYVSTTNTSETIGLITNEEMVETEASNNRTITAVLWAKIRCENEIAVAYEDGATVRYRREYVQGAVPVDALTPIFYVPMAVVKFVGTTPTIDTSVALFSLSDNGVTKYFRMLENGAMRALYSESASVLNIELTYYAPINWEIRTIDQTRVLVFPGSVYHSLPPSTAWLNSLNVCDFYDNTGLHNAILKRFNTSTYTYENVPLFFRIFPNFIDPSMTIDCTIQFAKDSTINPKTNNEESDIKKYEPRVYQYPYLYKARFYNGKHTALIPHIDEQTFKQVIRVKNFYTPNVNVATIGAFDGKPFEALQNNGQIVTSTDSFDYFIRNNGNKLLAGTINTALGGVSKLYGKQMYTPVRHNFTKKFKRGLVSGAVDVASNIIGSVAEMRDADNALDSYNVPAIDATTDLLQDFVAQLDFEIADEKIRDAVIKQFHYNGISINRMNSIRENYHTTFDYIRTSGCSLHFVTNRQDREELEDAYNNGITRWHINSQGVANINPDFLWFNKNLLNLSKEQYKMWEA